MMRILLILFISIVFISSCEHNASSLLLDTKSQLKRIQYTSAPPWFSSVQSQSSSRFPASTHKRGTCFVNKYSLDYIKQRINFLEEEASELRVDLDDSVSEKLHSSIKLSAHQKSYLNSFSDAVFSTENESELKKCKDFYCLLNYSYQSKNQEEAYRIYYYYLQTNMALSTHQDEKREISYCKEVKDEGVEEFEKKYGKPIDCAKKEEGKRFLKVSLREFKKLSDKDFAFSNEELYTLNVLADAFPALKRNLQPIVLYKLPDDIIMTQHTGKTTYVEDKKFVSFIAGTEFGTRLSKKAYQSYIYLVSSSVLSNFSVLNFNGIHPTFLKGTWAETVLHEIAHAMDTKLRAYPKTSACLNAIIAKAKWHKAS